MGFTDVVVRYAEDEQASYMNCVRQKVRFWRHVGGGLGGADWTIDDYAARLEHEINMSSSRRIYIDDCDAIYSFYGSQAFSNFLDAVRQVQHDNVILCFYMSNLTPWRGLFDLADSFNLTEFDVDIYHVPTTPVEPLLEKIEPSTLGVYLWCWAGSGMYSEMGETWETLTVEAVEHRYEEIKQHNVERVLVWMGHESDEHETGMDTASLYNYPRWWPIIKRLNEDFRMA